MTVVRRDPCRTTAQYSLLLLPGLAVFLFVDELRLVPAISAPSPPSTSSLSGIVKLLTEFSSDFSRWFPRIAYKYVLVPGLIELLFTLVLSSFLYREFVKVETEPLFDTSANRPERFRLLFLLSVTLTVVVLFSIGYSWYAIFDDIHQTAGRESWTVVTRVQEARSRTFMLLIVMNPMLYQLAVGLSMAILVKRFLGILVPMFVLGLLLYALLLTTCYCLFDHGPFDSLVVWRTTRESAMGVYPPEIALWITSLFGVACLWLSLWPARKLLVRRNQTVPEQKFRRGSY